MYEGSMEELEANFPGKDFKHVVVCLMQDTMKGQKRFGTALGEATNRLGRVIGTQGIWAIHTFVNQLGYNFTRWDGINIYTGLRAGVGELGRHNRIANPVLGSSY